MDNLAIFSVKTDCIKERVNNFAVPKMMPKCTGAKCSTTRSTDLPWAPKLTPRLLVSLCMVLACQLGYRKLLQ